MRSKYALHILITDAECICAHTCSSNVDFIAAELSGNMVATVWWIVVCQIVVEIIEIWIVIALVKFYILVKLINLYIVFIGIRFDIWPTPGARSLLSCVNSMKIELLYVTYLCPL